MLREGLRHHSWATEQLLGRCASLTEEELTRHIPAIYGSTLDTARHLVDADNWYLSCISRGDLGILGFDADGLRLSDLLPVAAANAAGWEAIWIEISIPTPTSSSLTRTAASPTRRSGSASPRSSITAAIIARRSPRRSPRSATNHPNSTCGPTARRWVS